MKQISSGASHRTGDRPNSAADAHALIRGGSTSRPIGNQKILNRNQPAYSLPNCPTGIRGLDEITDGSLPKGRPTLICGAAGCGKTLLATEFIVRSACEFNEPGVFISFEETGKDLADNVASLGFDLDALLRRKKVVVDHGRELRMIESKRQINEPARQLG